MLLVLAVAGHAEYVERNDALALSRHGLENLAAVAQGFCRMMHGARDVLAEEITNDRDCADDLPTIVDVRNRRAPNWNADAVAQPDRPHLVLVSRAAREAALEVFPDHGKVRPTEHIRESLTLNVRATYELAHRAVAVGEDALPIHFRDRPGKPFELFTLQSDQEL